VDLIFGKQGSFLLALGRGEPMARRTFDVIDICEIFVHWHTGQSKNEMAGSLGLSRNTVRKYVLRRRPRR
jgi:response regulator of citrate/malate metabolism